MYIVPSLQANLINVQMLFNPSEGNTAWCAGTLFQNNYFLYLDDIANLLVVLSQIRFKKVFYKTNHLYNEPNRYFNETVQSAL